MTLDELSQRFVGLELWGFWQAADMMIFRLGSRVETTSVLTGKSATIGTFALHLQCCCRITSDERILVGNFDVYNPPTTYTDPEEFDWTQHRDNYFLEMCRKIFDGSQKHIVFSVAVGRMGRFDLYLSTGLVLEVLPVSSFKRQEQWRIIEHDVAHYVFDEFFLDVISYAESEES